MPRAAAKTKPGPAQRFDTELRVYVTKKQYDAVAIEAEQEQRLMSNMVRVLLNEALAARSRAREQWLQEQER